MASPVLGEQTVKVQLDVDGARTQPPTATKNPSSRNASGTEQQVSSPPRHHSTPDHTLPWWSGVASFRHSEPESGLSPLRDRRTVRHDGDRLGTSGDTAGLIPGRGGFASTRGCPPRCQSLRRDGAQHHDPGRQVKHAPAVMAVASLEPVESDAVTTVDDAAWSLMGSIVARGWDDRVTLAPSQRSPRAAAPLARPTLFAWSLT